MSGLEMQRPAVEILDPSANRVLLGSLDHMRAQYRRRNLLASFAIYARRFDRWLKLFFDSAVEMDVATLSHRCCLSAVEGRRLSHMRWAVLRRMGMVMAWATAAGIVSEQGQGDSRRWRMNHPGVTIIHRNRKAFDVRRGLIGPRVSLGALIAREDRRRAEWLAELRDAYRNEIADQIEAISRATAVPAGIVGPAFPPVQTMGAMADNLDGYWGDMPVWSMLELRRALEGLPAEPRIGTDPQTDAPVPAGLDTLAGLDFTWEQEIGGSVRPIEGNGPAPRAAPPDVPASDSSAVVLWSAEASRKRRPTRSTK